jgi:hypothetical protein
MVHRLFLVFWVGYKTHGSEYTAAALAIFIKVRSAINTK